MQKGSFLGAFDVKTGKELWRTPRTDVPTWSTPTIHVVGGKTQILVNGWRHMGAYDFTTGEEIWRLKSVGGDIPVPTPIVGHGLVYLTTAHGPGQPVFAIRETAKGDISLAPDTTTNAHIAWSYPRDGACMISPVLYRGLLYVSKNNGTFSVFDAVTGRRRIRSGWATARRGDSPRRSWPPTARYFTSEDGDVYVVKAGRTYELLSKSPLGDYAMATPAIANGTLYFRTGAAVIAVK